MRVTFAPTNALDDDDDAIQKHDAHARVRDALLAMQVCDV